MERFQTPLETVQSVDLERYAGRWFEIARAPAPFERDTDRNVTAEYTLRPGNRVRVENRCTQPDGRIRAASGSARVKDPKSNAKLLVKFFPLMPAADYWIVGLDEDYRWAIVGEPQRRFLWVLSRVPRLDDATLAHVLREVDRAGYDHNALIHTPQDGN
ncbi:MAG: lipocalin family protein [Candidatus Eremiobacteraeota bacterium]|nr:lipocalin family protein [Candidatus Eremiobacteraeota bacterium]